MAQSVVLFGHVGYADGFKATLIPGLHKIPSDSGGDVSVISTQAGEVLAVKSRNLFTPEGLMYAQEWATKTHCTVFDVEMPEALRVGA